MVNVYSLHIIGFQLCFFQWELRGALGRTNKPAVGAISKAKIAEGLQSILSYSIQNTRKLDRIDAPGGRFEIFYPFYRKSSKNCRGASGEKKFFAKKSHNAERKLKRGAFSLARCCMLRRKKGNLFWFCSLGQQVKLGALKVCRKYKEQNIRKSKNLVSQFLKPQRGPFNTFPSSVQLVKSASTLHPSSCTRDTSSLMKFV